ncbi:MAG: polyprenyl diphosphate synthase [Candidatus Omnitrophota bacterium]|nr:di-trans,poly-cis-decaprenylcistransferase [Candidatus Omnitrophota bacterium]
MKVPNHIAIIMDGNGRWARSRGLPRTAGHKAGVENVKKIVRASKKQGIKVLTIFAFSTENWNRPRDEVNLLFSYLESFLEGYRTELIEEDIRLKVIGRRDRIALRIVRKIEEIETITHANKSFTFIIALDYGGRWDIVEAVKKMTGEDTVKATADISEVSLARFLSLGEFPDPDLLIRTSGEQRISNFLLWNLAYSEFYFPNVHWPDFSDAELAKAIALYGERERRFGAV